MTQPPPKSLNAMPYHAQQYKWTNEKLFHLASFFTDHGWVMPEETRFNADGKFWEVSVYAGKDFAGWYGIALNQICSTLFQQWYSWWSKLPTLEDHFTNHAEEQTNQDGLKRYIARCGNHYQYSKMADTLPHAIRDCARLLKVSAQQIFAHFDSTPFKISSPDDQLEYQAQAAMAMRARAVFKAMSPATEKYVSPLDPDNFHFTKSAMKKLMKP